VRVRFGASGMAGESCDWRMPSLPGYAPAQQIHRIAEADGRCIRGEFDCRQIIRGQNNGLSCLAVRFFPLALSHQEVRQIGRRRDRQEIGLQDKAKKCAAFSCESIAECWLARTNCRRGSFENSRRARLVD